MYIVYETKNIINGMIYIGVHGNNNPNYLGTGIKLLEAINKYGRENFIRTTLFTFDNKEDAYLKESVIVTDEFRKNDNNYNTALGGVGGYYSTGLVSIYDDKIKKYRSITKDEFDKGEYSGAAVGKCRAIDIATGKVIKTTSDDDRWESGEIVGITSGMTTAIETSSGKIIWATEDDYRWKTKEIVGVSSGRKWIKNIKLNKRKTVPATEVEKYLNDGWVLGAGKYNQNAKYGEIH